MSLALFEAIKRYSGFTGEDAAVLKQLYPKVKHAFPSIVDDFYYQISLHDTTRRMLENPEQIERLKKSFHQWLTEVFIGPHDEEYYQKRMRIGLAHVRIGLPQVYVFAAMSHVRRHLEAAMLEEAAMPENPRGLTPSRGQDFSALAKALDLELALIAGSYHEAEKYRDLVEFAPDMIHQVDREGRLLSVNQTELKRLGYTRDYLLSKRLEELVEEKDRNVIREHIKKVFEKGESRCEATLLTSRGERVEVEILATGVRDPLTGAIVSTRAYVRDISERKRGEEARRQLVSIVESSDDAIIGTTLDGIVVTWNGGAEKIYGYLAGEVKGTSALILLPAAQPEEFQRILETVQKGGRIANFETVQVRKDGKVIDVSLTVSPIKDSAGRITGASAIARDITESKRMARALIEQKGLARLGEMAAVVAHEVKNPLAGIGGAIQVIMGHLPPGSPDCLIIQEILDRLEALNNTVNDILLFARPRMPRLGPVPLLSLFQDTAMLLGQDPKLAGVKVETSGPDLMIPGDADLLKPAFLNLLLNAAQATGGNGRISIALKRLNGICRIDVSDNGPGIPLEMREKIFEPFFSTKHRGTGLGLPITKRIIEAHGGDISIECPEEGGTRVIVHLPLEAGKEEGIKNRK